MQRELLQHFFNVLETSPDVKQLEHMGLLILSIAAERLFAASEFNMAELVWGPDSLRWALVTIGSKRQAQVQMVCTGA